MAKKWTSFLKDTTPKHKTKEQKATSLDFEDILKDHEDIQALLKEKEQLEHALKNAPGTQKKDAGDSRFRESEIIPISKKKKDEKKWADNRASLLEKKKKEKKEAAAWEKKHAKKPTVTKPKRKRVAPVSKKETTRKKRPVNKKDSSFSKPKNRVHKKHTKNDIEQWLKERLETNKVIKEKKQEAQQWLSKREQTTQRSLAQLKEQKETVSKWIQKQETTKQKALDILKDKRVQEAIPKRIKKPVEDAYAYLDSKNKKGAIHKLTVDIKKVVSKKEMPFKKPDIKKNWGDILDKKRDAVSQTKKHKKEIERKMNVAPKIAKGLWEKRDLLKKERLKEALALKKEELKAEARKQARAQERKQQKKDDRFF
ncbi:hypothetical protein [uncultured Dokdonia sp.]|uniref:hypothetical protein n=1 Tax=uncultured Dokdonia sp. TaxID=575653 RepID=UPI0026144338|nr:hypothetical protein [uncultured Dokdonia sp.]